MHERGGVLKLDKYLSLKYLYKILKYLSLFNFEPEAGR